MENIDYESNEKETEEYQTIEIKYSLRPTYYDAFQCKAQNCRFNCCTGWDIPVNPDDYLRLQKQQGSEVFHQKLKQVLELMEPIQDGQQYTKMPCHDNGECCLLTKDALCALQLECGHEALPEVCKMFPRNVIDSYSGYEERSLILGCEAVLELLWNLPEGVDFILEDLPQEEYKIGHCKKDSYYPYFQEIRSLCIDMLQDRRFSIGERILLMGIFLQKFPVNAKEVENWCMETQMMMENPALIQISKYLMQSSEEMLENYIYQNMQLLMHHNINTQNKKLNEYRNQLINQLLFSIGGIKEDKEYIDIDTAQYQQCKEKFDKIFGDREYFFENIMVSICFGDKFPAVSSKEELWKTYIHFCIIYSLVRFIAITSCIEEVANQKERLFDAILLITRTVVQSTAIRSKLSDLLFDQGQISLAHMAILLSE